MLHEIQKTIMTLKKENSICILAHSYQSHDILEVADYTGDSFQLSISAKKAKQDTIVVCGVRFMAETVKLLSPAKRVILVNPEAGCPMAEQVSANNVLEYKKNHPDCTVVAYINTTAELKTVCDVCVTSSSAVEIVNKIANKDILFLPDSNLAGYVKRWCPDKNISVLGDGCPVHSKITEECALKAKRSHPSALFLVHPECSSEVVKHADFTGSTSAIMEFAKQSNSREFIIGTENSIAAHLQLECPEKRFFCLSKELICPDMKLTTISDVLNAVSGDGGEEIVIDGITAQGAVKCIDKMIELG